MSNFELRVIHDSQKGAKVTYIGYTWKIIDVLPAGTRVLYRPFWKLRKTGVIFT